LTIEYGYEGKLARKAAPLRLRRVGAETLARREKRVRIGEKARASYAIIMRRTRQ
jgi:hypothetical protein